MQKQVITHTKYTEKITGAGHDNCHGIVEHMENRINHLLAENEELRQKTQVTVKKVETNVVEKRPGLDAESAHKITELENRITELEFICSEKTREVETLSVSITKMRSFESDLDVARNRIHHLEQQLEEKILEWNAARDKYDSLVLLREKDLELIRVREFEIVELQKRLKELEILPQHLHSAQKNIEVLTAEVERLTILAKERDQEIDFLRKKMKELEGIRCINLRDHDELRTRIAMFEKLQHEFADLKNKYTALCTDYEREITIVRSKDKEIDSLNKTLQKEIKDSRKALDKELTHEEKLEHEIELLKKKLYDREVEVTEWRKKAAMVPELHKACESLEADNIALQNRIRKLEEINHQLDAKIAAMMKEIDVLRSELKRKESTFVSLQKEKTVLVSEFEKSQAESSVMLEKINEEKNREIAALNAKLYALNQDMASLMKEIDVLRSQCAALNTERANITKVLEEHTKAERDLFHKVEALKRERELLAKEIADMVAEKDRLKAFASSKDREVHKLDKDIHAYAKENEQLHFTIADLEKRLLAANSLLKERESEIISLRTTLKDVTISQKELFEAREKLAKENTFLSHRISELETSVTTISSKYTKLERIYNEIRGATAQIADVHDKLLETCEETERIKDTNVLITEKKTSMKSESTQAARFH